MRTMRFAVLTAGICAFTLGTSAAQAQGTITGQVTLPGGAPKTEAINVTNDKQHCESKGPLMPTEVIVDGKTKGVKNIVVWLRPDDDNLRAALPAVKNEMPTTHTVDQPCCHFEPRITAAWAGDKLEFKNSAPVPHNTNYTSAIEMFNVNLPPGTSKKCEKPLEAERGPILFSCNIHPWMKGYVRVFDHPYFAKTGDDGTFEIKDVPAGKYRIVYWHENGYHTGRDGAAGFPVEVKAGEASKLDPIALELQ